MERVNQVWSADITDRRQRTRFRPPRHELEEAGFRPIIPHRKNRVRPSRNDGRRLRRYRHRWLVERTNAWLHCYRGLATRWAYYSFMYVGLVYLAFIHIALQRF